MKILTPALALLLSATTVSFAQSLPNYGPNAPATGDSYGKPYSGAQPLRSRSYRDAYAAQQRVHRRAYWRWHHRYQ